MDIPYPLFVNLDNALNTLKEKVLRNLSSKYYFVILMQLLRLHVVYAAQ